MEPKCRPGQGSGAKRNNPQELCGQSQRKLSGQQRQPPSSSSSPSSAAAAAATPGPAAPGGPSRVTHGHGAGWEGVKSSFLLSSPSNDSHSLPSQVLIKQEKNAPARVFIDNYVATHRRVSSECPELWSDAGSAP